MGCRESEGWQARAGAKVGVSTAVGLAVGAVLATTRGAPLAATTAASAASFAILAATFAAAQEATRAARCEDSAANSGVGGAAAGALLFASHGAAPARGAAIVGAAGAAAHWAAERGGLRRWLVARGLLDPEALGALARADEDERGLMAWAARTIPGVRRMDEAEFAQRSGRHAARVAAAQRGELPPPEVRRR